MRPKISLRCRIFMLFKKCFKKIAVHRHFILSGCSKNERISVVTLYFSRKLLICSSVFRLLSFAFHSFREWRCSIFVATTFLRMTVRKYSINYTKCFVFSIASITLSTFKCFIKQFILMHVVFIHNATVFFQFLLTGSNSS